MSEKDKAIFDPNGIDAEKLKSYNPYKDLERTLLDLLESNKDIPLFNVKFDFNADEGFEEEYEDIEGDFEVVKEDQLLLEDKKNG